MSTQHEMDLKSKLNRANTLINNHKEVLDKVDKHIEDQANVIRNVAGFLSSSKPWDAMTYLRKEMKRLGINALDTAEKKVEL